MHRTVVEVKEAVLNTFDGDRLEVSGGAYLSPEAYLASETQLQRLLDGQQKVEQRFALLSGLVVGAGILGFVAGFWLGRPTRPKTRLSRLRR